MDGKIKVSAKTVPVRSQYKGAILVSLSIKNVAGDIVLSFCI